MNPCNLHIFAILQIKLSIIGQSLRTSVQRWALPHPQVGCRLPAAAAISPATWMVGDGRSLRAHVEFNSYRSQSWVRLQSGSGPALSIPNWSQQGGEPRTLIDA